MPINNNRLENEVKERAQKILDKIRNKKNQKKSDPVVKPNPTKTQDKDESAKKDIGYQVKLFPDNRVIIGKITDSKVLKAIKELFGQKPRKTEMLNEWTERIGEYAERLVERCSVKGAFSQVKRHFKFFVWFLGAKELHILFPDGAKEEGIFKDLTKEQRDKINNEILRYESARKKALAEAHKRAMEAKKKESNNRKDAPKPKNPVVKKDEKKDGKKNPKVIQTPDILKKRLPK